MEEENTEEEKKPVRENPVFGRKVFIVNPDKPLEQLIVDYLHNEEYETYSVIGYRDVKSILRKNPDSICYFNIDEELPKKSWLNFLKSFADDEKLSTTIIGILTQKIDKVMMDKFMTEVKVEAGLVLTSKSKDDILGPILSTLDAYGAKGRRQYVRATLPKNSDSFLMWTINNRMIKIKMLDISSVGMAILIPKNMQQLFVQGLLMKDMTLQLSSRQFYIECLIYAVKPSKTGELIGVLLLKGGDAKVKNYIREYVSDILAQNLYTSIGECKPDSEEY